ncbi:rare lipoprotein A [Halopseudomonas litoralis]|uniref:Endolytic peptidoglycan transglycosylase RlpA n=2 Tax=Halopseudomonas litoralis TaxID=797277 RepID=A0A1H1L9Z9_9GAMM|nr:septal ring lytic transglycosylase RlpA family protein [Halopseudomonas litoralis]SDR71336.1 rare lipoprotein A [Halopseudomonas litoralis]
MAVEQTVIRSFLGRIGSKPMWLGQVALAALLSMSGFAALGDDHSHDEGGLSYTAEGRASYYSSRFHGQPTASGEPYDETNMTAAHPSLPFDAQLCITNLNNGRSTTVRVNDRGPFVGGRIVDVSMAAARELGMLRAGIIRVRVETCELES